MKVLLDENVSGDIAWRWAGMRVDKSLQEVWDWKDVVYQEMKHLSAKEAARKIHDDAERIKKKYGLKLMSLSSGAPRK